MYLRGVTRNRLCQSTKDDSRFPATRVPVEDPPPVLPLRGWYRRFIHPAAHRRVELAYSFVMNASHRHAFKSIVKAIFQLQDTDPHSNDTIAHQEDEEDQDEGARRVNEEATYTASNLSSSFNRTSSQCETRQDESIVYPAALYSDIREQNLVEAKCILSVHSHGVISPSYHPITLVWLALAHPTQRHIFREVFHSFCDDSMALYRPLLSPSPISRSPKTRHKLFKSRSQNPQYPSRTHGRVALSGNGSDVRSRTREIEANRGNLGGTRRPRTSVSMQPKPKEKDKNSKPVVIRPLPWARSETNVSFGGLRLSRTSELIRRQEESLVAFSWSGIQGRGIPLKKPNPMESDAVALTIDKQPHSVPVRPLTAFNHHRDLCARPIHSETLADQDNPLSSDTHDAHSEPARYSRNCNPHSAPHIGSSTRPQTAGLLRRSSESEHVSEKQVARGHSRPPWGTLYEPGESEVLHRHLWRSTYDVHSDHVQHTSKWAAHAGEAPLLSRNEDVSEQTCILRVPNGGGAFQRTNLKSTRSRLGTAQSSNSALRESLVPSFPRAGVILDRPRPCSADVRNTSFH